MTITDMCFSEYPHIEYVDERLYSKIMIEKTNTDGINGYGHLREYVVSAWVVVDVCTRCGVTALDGYFDERHKTCVRHAWKRKLRKVAAGSGRDLPAALCGTEAALCRFASEKGSVLFECFAGET